MPRRETDFELQVRLRRGISQCLKISSAHTLKILLLSLVGHFEAIALIDIRDPSRACSGLLKSFALHESPSSGERWIGNIYDPWPAIRRTNRGYRHRDPLTKQTLRDIYPDAWFRDLSGLVVLDIGCGDGAFVMELNSGKLGPDISAWGVDLVLIAEQKDQPFIHATADAMPIKSGSVDVAFESVAFIAYPEFLSGRNSGLEQNLRSLAEVHRVLRRGGRLRIGHISESVIFFV